MITSRAVLFGFIGGCFYLIAIVNSLPPLFYALMWLTAGILASCFGISLLSLYGLRASWHLEAGSVAQAVPVEGLEPARDEDGDEAARQQSDAPGGPDAPETAGLSLEIGNAGTFSKSDIVIEVVLRPVRAPRASRPTSGEAANNDNNDNKDAGDNRDEREEKAWARGGEKIVRRFLLEALPSRALLLTTLPLHDLERGRYCVEAVRAVGSDVLGLFRPRRTLAPTSRESREFSGSGSLTQNLQNQDDGRASEVVVGPRLVRGMSGHLAGVLGAGSNGGVSAAMSGRSDEFGGTRPYVAGDDLRFVHWKSTARRGEMVVREWERAVQNHSIVVWDGAALPAASKSLLQSPLKRERDASGAPLLAGAQWHEGEAERAWQRSVEWSLEVALSLSSALARGGEPCTLWRIDGAPASSEVGSSAPSRAAEMLADARATRASPLHEALGLALSRRGREMGGRAFVIAPVPLPSLRNLASRLRHTRLRHTRLTVALVDASRFESVGARASPGAWKAWREMLLETEASLREVGVRVVRLPVESPVESEDMPVPGLERFHSDTATREALRALIEDGPST